MTAPDETRVDAVSPPRAALTDKRIRPTGVLPRALQTWLMVALALVILGIIYLTGHREPVVTPRFSEPGQGTPSALPADRIRTYQQRVGEGEQRLRQELDARTAEARVLSTPTASGDATVVDPLAEERRRREYHSLFADNVALSRRPPDSAPMRSQGDLRAFEEMAARAWESAQRPALPGSPVGKFANRQRAGVGSQRGRCRDGSERGGPAAPNGDAAHPAVRPAAPAARRHAHRHGPDESARRQLRRRGDLPRHDPGVFP
jgi:hypothetical protein